MLASTLGDILVIYLFGIPDQALVTQLSIGETIISSLVFLPGDFFKAVVATLITMGLYRAYPRAFENETKKRAPEPELVSHGCAAGGRGASAGAACPCLRWGAADH